MSWFTFLRRRVGTLLRVGRVGALASIRVSASIRVERVPYKAITRAISIHSG